MVPAYLCSDIQTLTIVGHFMRKKRTFESWNVIVSAFQFDGINRRNSFLHSFARIPVFLNEWKFRVTSSRGMLKMCYGKHFQVQTDRSFDESRRFLQPELTRSLSLFRASFKLIESNNGCELNFSGLKRLASSLGPIENTDPPNRKFKWRYVKARYNQSPEPWM